MKLMINGRNLEGKRTGVGRYLANLLDVWCSNESKNSFDIYFKNEIPGDHFLQKENTKGLLIPNLKLLDIGPVWENFALPRALRNNKGADIFFTSNYTLPLMPIPAKRVVTIFDISYIAHPEWFPKRQLASLVPLTGPTVRGADLILTGSMATKREILKFYDIDADKIKITNLGVDKRFLELDKSRSEVESERVKLKYKLEGKVVLFVGLLMNRRNIPQLMRAVATVQRRSGEKITLVLVGQNNTHPHQDIDKLAAEESISDSLRWIKYTTDDDLFGLYKAADVFMCISLYEGFNITPLEALGLGVPTVCSNLSSLPEVVGDAAYMMDDPRDDVEMSNAIEKVLFDCDLASNLKNRGIERAKLFSWERCATETMAFLEAVD